MALSGISRRREAFGPVKARFPRVEKCQDVEVGVGRWEGEHTHRSREKGNGRGGKEDNKMGGGLGKRITFEM